MSEKNPSWSTTFHFIQNLENYTIAKTFLKIKAFTAVESKYLILPQTQKYH